MTVNVAVPLCPATIVRVVGLTDSWKSAAGTLMVWVAEATALLAKPVAVAMALIVSVELTVIVVVYLVDVVVGVVPLVV